MDENKINDDTITNDLVDINLDINIAINIDLDMNKDMDKDDLETIRFESVPERKQSNPIIHKEECNLFSWIFNCFI
jgi:hypothetical protein